MNKVFIYLIMCIFIYELFMYIPDKLHSIHTHSSYDPIEDVYMQYTEFIYSSE